MVAVGREDIGAIEEQAVRAGTGEGSTRPVVTPRADTAKRAIVDVPGIREVVGL